MPEGGSSPTSKVLPVVGKIRYAIEESLSNVLLSRYGTQITLCSGQLSLGAMSSTKLEFHPEIRRKTYETAVNDITSLGDDDKVLMSWIPSSLRDNRSG